MPGPQWLEEFSAAAPYRYVGVNPCYKVEDVGDIRLSFYRLTRIRDTRVYSYLYSHMLKHGRNYKLSTSRVVVDRALEGIHELVSVLVTEELLEEMASHIESRRLVEGVYVCTRAQYEEIVGVTVNGTQACAAILDLQTATEIRPAENLEESDNVKDSKESKESEESKELDVLNASEELGEAEAKESAKVSKPSIPAPILAPVKGNLFSWQDGCEFGLDRKPEASYIKPPILILDNVRSSDNVGVILRTAFSLGVTSIIATKVAMGAIGCRAARTSMGALCFTSVYRSEDLVKTIKDLQDLNIKVYATTPSAHTPIAYSADKSWALVVGNEQNGSDEEVMAACSERVVIPQVSGDSLSVSVAAGICLFTLLNPPKMGSLQ